jgi:alkanesulfonate monooxygenase SsuD/methylene tetrahydromethanopterin reductase-like flavin-dependent oxidoreductase (luciferase family)
MEDHGANYNTRFKLMRERILAMKELWTREQASFQGEMVKFGPCWSYPKPAQKPHPPILLGGSTDYTLKRVVEFCNGWIPLAFRGFEPATEVARLKRAAEEGKRDYSTVTVTAFGAPPDKALLEACGKEGVHRVTLSIPDAGRDDILRTIDRHAALKNSL